MIGGGKRVNFQVSKSDACNIETANFQHTLTS